MALMNGTEFVLRGHARDKFKRNEPLTREEMAVVQKFPLPEPNLCACGCGVELEPRIDGERPTIEGREVNSDCYYRDLGAEIEKHPIGGLGGVRH